MVITLDCKVWSWQGQNQTCSPRQDLFNDVSHSQLGGWEEVDSRLLGVGSQIASLTPDPSFHHNLGYKCSNDQCEAIFYMYASRPFQWHQEHLNARCFGPCCRALNIRESRRTPNPHFFQVLGFTPTLGQSRVATVSGLPLGSPGTNSHLDVVPMEWRKIYYMGEGGGFPRVQAVVSEVSPKLPVGCPSTKGAPECELINLLVGLMQVRVSE